MMKWYETKKPWKGETEWWTQRDNLGICYSIKCFYGENKFHLFICDNKAGTYKTLIDAQKEAAAHYNSNHN